MGLDPVSLGLAMGGATLASSLASGVAGMGQQKMQAQAQAAQASQMRQQAQAQAFAGQKEAEALDRQRAQIKRQYEEARGANAVSLGAGNVDMSSGSALAVADGNAIAFADDVGENAYQKAIRQWETDNAVKAASYQADVLDAQASYSRQQSQNWLPTLLNAGLAGAGSFLSGYGMAGGRIGASVKEGIDPNYLAASRQAQSAFFRVR